MDSNLIEKIKKLIRDDQLDKIKSLSKKIDHVVFIYFVIKYASIDVCRYFMKKIACMPEDIDYHKLLYILSNRTEEFSEIVDDILDKSPNPIKIAVKNARVFIDHCIDHNNPVMLENFLRRLREAEVPMNAIADTFLKAVALEDLQCANILVDHSNKIVLTINVTIRHLDKDEYDESDIHYIFKLLRKDIIAMQRGVIQEFVLYTALAEMKIFYYLITLYPLTASFILKSLETNKQYDNTEIYNTAQEIHKVNVAAYRELERSK